MFKKKGNTPLHLAVAKKKPCYECVYLLLKYHATSLVFNNRLQSPTSILKLIISNSSNSSSAPSDSQKTATNFTKTSNVTGTMNSTTGTKSNITNNNNNNNASANKDQLNANLDAQAGDTTSTHSSWNYSTSSIHSSLISEIFSALDPSSASFVLSADAALKPSNMPQGAGRQTQSKSVVTNIISPKVNTKNTLTKGDSSDIISSVKHVGSVASKEPQITQSAKTIAGKNLNKSYTQNQNANKHLPLSHSLKNISKIKNYSSSNSLIISEAILSTQSGSTSVIKRETNPKMLLRENSSMSESVSRPAFSSTVIDHSSKIVQKSSNPATPVKRFVFQKSKSSKQILHLEKISNNQIMADPTSTPVAVPTSYNSPMTPTTGMTSNFLGAESINENFKSRSMMNVGPMPTSPSCRAYTIESGKDSPAQTPTHITDKREHFLLKTYARYSKAAPKSGSAVVARMGSNGNKQSTYDLINRQVSLTNVNLINRVSSNTSSNNTNIIKGAKAISKRYNLEGSQSSVETDVYLMSQRSAGQNNATYDNASIVSSKISLFKKAVCF